MNNIHQAITNDGENATFHAIKKLKSEIRRMQIICVILSLCVISIFIFAFTKNDDLYLKVHGITIIDSAGRPRILIGAPALSGGRNRKDAQTASLVVLGPEGQDRVILGEAPNPVIGGKTYPRISPSYGLLIHDKTGKERGGMSFLDNGHGVISLDRKNQDAVEMVVNDQSGFAGLTINYEGGISQYREAVRIGTKNNEVWLSMSDTSKNERAAIHVRDTNIPKLELVPAAKRP